ncbi:uncharacterized protein EV422DRAFT_565110 [Fimicolochytrium jonesii]|uniref:uncharacterized protein n=1 Tax=Fimicolochytrium jonesii TaxID=1396493 RepID=UPI0022FEDDD2|nr:uncharacterized protein EV422DRAFT_565110 [Fimicolochytrium jonesii]KAI8824417.1 hypothetical protein EV422DRAFT_565110 [Fimicolochytrium jonesii]
MPAPIITANDLENGQMKSVDVGGDQKVLIAKVQGKVYATTNKCTHFGAPLEKGVLTADGRLTCPWHGACFNVKTGDIEDAPGMACLKTFPVAISGDKIHIEVTPEAAKQTVPIPNRPSPKKDDTVVIIGNGSGGQSAAEALREHGFGGKIVVFGKEPYLPIDRTKLSKGLDVSAEKIALRPEEFYREREIALHAEKEVKEVDLAKRQVTLTDGTTQGYSHLVLSPGSYPRPLDVPGKELKNVHLLRSLVDANALHKAIKSKEKPKVIIVGTGFIGLELASVLAKDGTACVTVLARNETPLKPVLGEEIGKFIKRWHEEKGVTFKVAQPKSFEPSVVNPSEVGTVKLTTGEELAADVVLVAIGAQPATTFLKPTGLLNDDGSIEVDNFLRVHSHPEVYVAGDVARIPLGGTDQKVRVEHWNVARNTGRSIARNIAIASGSQPPASADSELEPFTKVPYFWTVQYGNSVRYAGGGPFDEVYVDGDLTSKKGDETSFVAYYANKGAVVAVASLNKDPVVSQFSELLRLKRVPTLAEIKGGKSILSVPLGPANAANL